MQRRKRLRKVDDSLGHAGASLHHFHDAQLLQQAVAGLRRDPTLKFFIHEVRMRVRLAKKSEGGNNEA